MNENIDDHSLNEESYPKNESNERDYFSNLPNELYMEIFRYIPQIELQTVIPLVSSRFYQVSVDPYMWKQFSLTHLPNQSAERVIESVLLKPFIKILRGRRLKCINSVLHDVLQLCPAVKCLDLGFCGNLTSNNIELAVTQMQNVQHINLEGTLSLTDSDVFTICTSLPHLNTLDLSHCVGLSDSSLDSIGSYVSYLKALNIDGLGDMTDWGIQVIIVSQWWCLESFIIDGMNLSNKALNGIEKCLKIKLLSISFCENFTDSLLFKIRQLKELSILRLRKGTNFTMKGLCDLFCQSQSKLTNLTILNLNECLKINDHVISKFINISHLNRLGFKSLSLSWCANVTDAGIEHIVDTFPRMKMLSVAGNHRITGAALIRIPEAMPNMTILNLAQANRISDRILEKINDGLPELLIINYYGERYGENMDNLVPYIRELRQFDLYDLCGHYSIYADSKTISFCSNDS